MESVHDRKSYISKELIYGEGTRERSTHPKSIDMERVHDTKGTHPKSNYMERVYDTKGIHPKCKLHGKGT